MTFDASRRRVEGGRGVARRRVGLRPGLKFIFRGRGYGHGGFRGGERLYAFCPSRRRLVGREG